MTTASREHNWHEYDSPEALAASLSVTIEQALEDAIAARGQASFAVSGGKTPIHLFHALSNERPGWGDVTVTLVDERFVPPQSPRSNEGFVRRDLLKNEAAKARFIGLYQPAESVEAAAAEVSRTLGSLPLPLDFVVLGMGPDGHTASFFPDAAGLENLLDPASGAIIMPVHAASAGEDRLTMSLTLIAKARQIVVHIEGDDKRVTLRRALETDASPPLPIRTVLDHAENPVEIHWAPER